MIENRIKIFTCFIKLYIFLFYNITLAQHSNISNDSITSLITTAFENYELQNHKTSLDYAHAALKHAHKCNDENLIAKAYNVIGLNYQEFLDTNRVIDIFTKAYVLVKNTSDYQLQFDILNNLANAYKIENPTKAIEIYNQALQLDQTKIKYVAILFCKVNIAKAYYVLKQIKIQHYLIRLNMLIQS